MVRTILNIIMLLLVITPARSSAQQPADDKQLQEVVVVGSKHKQQSLTSRGRRIPGAVSMFTPDKLGYEVGATLTIRHRFDLEEITFDIISNSVKGTTLSIQIYRDSTYTPQLSQPLLVNIPEGKRLAITAIPTEHTLLEAGDYIVAITFADCDESVKQQWTDHEQWDSQTRYKMQSQSIQFPLYLKAGHIRNAITEAFEKCTTNIGIKVKGVAYL